MEKRMRTKVVWLLVIMVLFALLATACTTPSDTSEETKAPVEKKTTEETKTPEKKEKTYFTYDGENTTELPIVDEPITLTYWTPFTGLNAKIMDSFAEIRMYEELMALTNIQIEFVHPAIDQHKEEFKLMIASGEIPDIVEMTYMKADDYPGGPEQAIKNNVFVALNDLIDENAPNFKKAMGKVPSLERDLKTDSGLIYAFQMIEETIQPPYGGPIIRKDWLEDLGLEVPVTISDWETVLRAFKDEKGATSPLITKKEGIPDYFAFGGAYNISYRDGSEFYLIGDKVHYGPIEDEFVEYIKLLNSWYEEGLIDQDFLSYDGSTGSNTIQKMVTGQAGAVAAGFWEFAKYEDPAAEEDANFSLVAAPYPVLNEGDTCTIRQTNEHVRGNPTFISKDSEYINEAVKFVDTYYSDQGYLFCNYGVEGESYTMVDGEPTFTEEVLNDPMFTVPYNRHAGPFNRNYAKYWYNAKQNTLDAMEIWTGDNSGMLPGALSMTTEEGAKYSKVMSDISTYVQEMVPKYIMGNETDFEKFTNQIKSMGIQEMIDIKQAAFERYNAR